MSQILRDELRRIAGLLGAPEAAFVMERPRDAGHGDLATNLAMVLAKPLRTSPRRLAERILQELRLPPSVVAKTEIAGPGFINFWLAGDELSAAIREVIVLGAHTRYHSFRDAKQLLRQGFQEEGLETAEPQKPVKAGGRRGPRRGRPARPARS